MNRYIYVFVFRDVFFCLLLATPYITIFLNYHITILLYYYITILLYYRGLLRADKKRASEKKNKRTIENKNREMNAPIHKQKENTYVPPLLLGSQVCIKFLQGVRFLA